MQLHKAPLFSPPCNTVATPRSATTGSWSDSEDESEEDPDGKDFEEEDSINWMVSKPPYLKSTVWTSPLLISTKVTGTSAQFRFPHGIGVPPEVALGLVPPARLLEEQADGVAKRVWPGTLHFSLLQHFINLHFAGDDELYWGFEIWASESYYNDPTNSPSVFL